MMILPQFVVVIQIPVGQATILRLFLQTPLTIRMGLIGLNDYLAEAALTLGVGERLRQSVNPVIDPMQMDQAVTLHSLHAVSDSPPQSI